jgi:hypothetical protein
MLDEERRLAREMDGDLRAMLAVEPSPAFEARVRARVAGERQRSAWWMTWRIPAVVGAVAAVVLVVVSVMRSGPDGGVRPPAPQLVTIQPAPPVTPSQPVPEAPIAKPQPERAASRRIPVPRSERVVAVARRAEPEVLVPRDQEETLRKLVAGLRQGRVDLSTLPVAAESTTGELKELTIPLLEIEPLAAPVTNTGGPGVENRRSNSRSAL